MPGPPPKDPSLRARRNKTATSAKLSVDGGLGVDVPELRPLYKTNEETGEFVEVPWHPYTLDWWAAIWSSPMAPEFLKADRYGLFLLAELEDRFNKADSTHGKLELAKEIRLQRAMYGLTPMDRRRLQWEVERSEDAVEKGTRRRRTTKEREAVADEGEGIDPRSLLGIG